MSSVDFTKILKDKHLKVTAQRVAILDEIYKNGHSSVDDIYMLIKERIPRVSLATIYKNILLMQNAEVLKSIKTPTQKQKYELNKNPHIHLHCRICDKLEDFDLDMSDFRAYCEEKSGYSKIDDTAVIFSGVCRACQ
ncbi:Fur family transcriptional regulator [Helicobacter sp. 23-1044]